LGYPLLQRDRRCQAEESLSQYHAQLEDRVEARTAQLQTALANVKTIRGLLPICSNCKKIRNDAGYWQQIEAYVSEHSLAEFSHGICPDCGKELYPDHWARSQHPQSGPR
jgi:DNA repair exonuclease SbcCD ATPase subunit